MFGGFEGGSGDSVSVRFGSFLHQFCFWSFHNCYSRLNKHNVKKYNADAEMEFKPNQSEQTRILGAGFYRHSSSATTQA